MKKTVLYAAALCCLGSPSFAETAIPQSAIQSLNVTVYTNGLGLVKDTRAVTFEKGANTVSFLGVSAQIQPESALFSGKGLKILEQNFNFDLLSRFSLLQKFLGKQIQVISTNPATGNETVEDATVLSADNGLVLKIGSRIETDSNARLIFPDIPANLRDKPTLTVDLTAASAGKQNVELSYLTNGLTWRADYVAELNDAENAINLNGWVTLTNNSGVDYTNADIQFVAGEVNRVTRPQPRPMLMAARMTNKLAFEGAADMAQEPLMDYHLYSLDRKTDILSNQTKQLALLSGTNIKAQKEYRFENIVPLYGNQKEFESRNAAVRLTFENDKKSNLGIALPAGIVRVYKANRKQQIFFVGEDRIPHTAENEKVKLTLGEAFDVTASGKQTAFTQFAQNSYEATYEFTFKNAKETPVTIQYYQSFPNEWTISQNSAAYAKENAGQVSWTIPVPAKGKTVLSYTVRVKTP